MARQDATWKWNPEPKQQALYEEWKSFCIGLLITAREGFHIRSIPTLLEEQTGEQMPLRKMGFPSICHFLYTMADSIEVRTLLGQYYIFVKDHAIPESLLHVRDMVLKQAKDKSCKSKTGRIRRPTKNQSTYVPIHTFLAATSNAYNSYQQQRPIPSRPVLVPAAGYSNRNMGVYNGVRTRGGGSSNRGSSSSYQNRGPSSSRLKWALKPASAPTYTAPIRPRYIPGLVDDDEDDEDYSDGSGFDVVSARPPPPAVNDENKKTNVMPSTAAAKPVVTPSFSLTAVTVPKPALPKEPEPSSFFTFKERQQTQLAQASSPRMPEHKPFIPTTNASSSLKETAHTREQQLTVSSAKTNTSSNIRGATEAVPLMSLPSAAFARQQDETVQANIDKITKAMAKNSGYIRKVSEPTAFVADPPAKPVVKLETVIESAGPSKSPSLPPLTNTDDNISPVPPHPNAQQDTTPSKVSNRMDDDVGNTPKVGYKLGQRNDLLADLDGLRLNYKLQS
ncbi:hypothetical protein Ocin01_11191, partial [Orchesella cincta]